MVYLGIILYLICLVGTPISILVLVVRAVMKRRIRKNIVTTGLFLAGFVMGVVIILRSSTIEGEESLSVIDTREAEDIVADDEDEVYDDETEKEYFADVQNNDDTSEEMGKNVFNVLEYPYKNKKDAEKLMKVYRKAMEASITDFICLEEISEGGIIREEVMHYKKTVNDGNAAYRYYGKINKKGEPDGTGILFVSWTDMEENGDGIGTAVCYIGEFKDGYKDGYGIEYWEYNHRYMVDYEGEFKEGKYHGEGIDYLYDVSESTVSSVAKRDGYYSQAEGNNLEIEPVWLSLMCYEGEFKEGKYDGKGKAYWGVDDDNKEILNYEGEFKEGKYEGNGTLYFDNGSVKYKGNFKKGDYSGKGTLYDEQGNVVHKGKFKNGDIE